MFPYTITKCEYNNNRFEYYLINRNITYYNIEITICVQEKSKGVRGHTYVFCVHC